MENSYLVWVLVLPLVSAGWALSFASEKTVGLVSTVLAGLTWLASIALVLAGGAPFSWSIGWWQIGTLHMEWHLLLTPYGAMLLAAMCFVSFAVHLFSITYITQNRKRYFATLNFFTVTMTGLLISDHLLVLFCFWELMGFCSYLLIGFWREKPAAAAAATKAFIINKVGDAALLAALLLVFAASGSFHLSELLASGNTSAALLPGILFFVAIAAKSAQWPLHSWLPDAMEGPTPVSALLHAATLVAAGVVLYGRIFPLLAPAVHTLFLVAGLLTACLGGYQALVSTDLKKILAYSTLSQLGLMIATMATGAVDAGLMHLLTHAYFKSGLFLVAGLIIHHYQHKQPDLNAQDLRHMGGLRSSRWLFMIFLLAAGALAGIPFSAGFLSKENLLIAMLAFSEGPGFVATSSLLLFFAATFLTVLYCWRLVVAIFLGPELYPLLPLPKGQWVAAGALAATCGWYMVSFDPFEPYGWLAQAMGAGFSQSSWLPAVASIGWLAIAGVVARFTLENKSYKFARPLLPMDAVYRQVILQPVQRAAGAAGRFDQHVLDRLLHVLAGVHVAVAHLIGWFDAHVVDGVVNGGARLLAAIGNLTRKPLQGQVQRYLAWAALGMIIFLFWMLN